MLDWKLSLYVATRYAERESNQCKAGSYLDTAICFRAGLVDKCSLKAGAMLFAYFLLFVSRF